MTIHLPECFGEPAWRRVVKTMEDVPDSVFEGIPADSSEQLDHYIYRSPRNARYQALQEPTRT
jgi:hypothetical protein